MHPWYPHLVTFPRFLDPISWWWLSVKGYAFTSSGLQLSVPAALILYVRHHICVERRCYRLGHPDPEHGHPVCRKHQPKLS